MYIDERNSFLAILFLFLFSSYGGASVFPRFPGKIRVAILGPPGVGKGTLCNAFREKHAVNHFSVGDMLRQVAADMKVDYVSI